MQGEENKTKKHTLKLPVDAGFVCTMLLLTAAVHSDNTETTSCIILVQHSSRDVNAVTQIEFFFFFLKFRSRNGGIRSSKNSGGSSKRTLQPLILAACSTTNL
jgi:hypothetical protein